jgi:hypothetical protein
VIRRHRFALAFLVVLTIIPFLEPLLRNEVFVLRDHLDYFQPLRWFTAEELAKGQIPFWNPYNASGEPWFANPQTGVFYPASWLFLALPFTLAYTLFLHFHLVLLGWGVYLLLARRNAPGAALLGAVAAVFSGPVLSLLDISNNLATLAWVPLVLWCAAEGAWRRGGVVLTLAFLGGEPFFAALAALLYVVVRRHRDVIGTAAIALGLSSVQLLPFLESVRGSDRTGAVSAAEVLSHSMTLQDWVRVAIPSSLVTAPFGQSYLPTLYAGLVVCILALIGLTTIRRRPDLWGWVALLVASVGLAMGPAVIGRLPVTLFRYPSRLVAIAVLALVALAAAGWDRIRRDKRWLDLILIAVISADLLPQMSGLLKTGPWSTDVVPFDRAIGARTKIVRVDPEPGARLASMAGYLNLYQHRFDAFSASPVMSWSYLSHYLAVQDNPTRERLDAFAIGYVLTGRDLGPPFTSVARKHDARVYAIPNARAMAVCISDGRTQPLALEMSSAHARVTVDAARPCTVALSQQDAPGWTVTVDGAPAEKRVFAEVFRAVDVPAGRHEVLWRYRPVTFVAGAVMTLVTLFLLTLSLFVKRSERRSFSSVRASSE